MAELVLIDAHISLGGDVLSDHFTSVTLETTAEAQGLTAFGDEWMTRLGGLKDWTVTADFNQDFAAGELDATLWPLLGTSVAVLIRPTSDARSTGNPEFSGNAILTSYPPLGNSVGEAAVGSVTLEGNGQLQRLTS